MYSKHQATYKRCCPRQIQLSRGPPGSIFAYVPPTTRSCVTTQRPEIGKELGLGLNEVSVHITEDEEL
ncbi:Protein of unknown function [Gryllus bimaculatus]|nr:Protein of unknown function [Gryllus bimaculatus]